MNLRRLAPSSAVLVTLLATLFAPAAPAGAFVSRSNVFTTMDSICGRVMLYSAPSGTTAEVTPKLPIRVYVVDADRGIPRTLVNTITTATQAGTRTPIFTTAPNGVGTGVRVELEWNGGTDAFMSDSYQDTCPGTFFPMTPTRALDTRVDNGESRLLVAGTARIIDPRLVPGVPQDRVTALALNVTVTEPLAPGFLTVWPCSLPRPRASTLNFEAGQTMANLALADLVGYPDTGRVCIYTSATTHLVADITGFFRNDQDPLPAGGRLNVIDTPRRALDTRGPVAANGGQVRRLALAGTNGVPATGVFGVAMNVTAVNATVPGFVTVYPCDADRPNASTVNYVPGRPVPNSAVVGLSASGELCIFTLTDVDVVIDVTAYFGMSGSLFDAWTLLGARLVDTRTSMPIPAEEPTRVRLGIYTNTVHVINVTVTAPERDGWLTVYPCKGPVPATSTLNFRAGENVANMTIVRTDLPSDICVYSTASTHLVVDVQGWERVNSTRAPAS